MKSNDDTSSSSKKSSASNAKNNDKKPEVIAYKYSKRGKGQLNEAIVLAGISVFLKHQVETGEFKTVEVIDEPSRIIRPPTTEEHPYEPYEFSDLKEIESYKQRARKETVHSLYQKAKSIVHKYNDQDPEKLILLAVDIVWSYFQDKFRIRRCWG
jgi:hypothetical protein